MTVTHGQIIGQKKFADLTLDEVIYCHLSNSRREFTADMVVTSCLDGIENEMRQSRGTDKTSNYAPFLAAFAILDQIGSCYKDTTVSSTSTRTNIKKALHYFGGMDASSAEVQSLYALRNGLVHDASLTCQETSGKWHIFRYDEAVTGFVRLPTVEWDGSFDSLKYDMVTWVNMRAFTDHVSTVISKLRKCYFERRADLVALQSRDDIMTKFLFWHGR